MWSNTEQRYAWKSSRLDTRRSERTDYSLFGWHIYIEPSPHLPFKYMEADLTSAIYPTPTNHTRHHPLLFPPHNLNPTINLIHHMRPAPRIPVRARLRHDVGDLHLRDFGRPLEDVHRVAHAGVPRDVAVVRPHAGIVGRDLHDQVAVPAEHVRVAPDRVRGVG